MTLDSLTPIEQDLRQAVAAADFPEVSRLLIAYSSAAGSYVKSLPLNDPSIPAIATRVNTLLEWTRLMLHTARAFCQSDLRRLSTLTGYLQSQPTDAPTMGMTA